MRIYCIVLTLIINVVAVNAVISKTDKKKPLLKNTEGFKVRWGM